ncbi:MAG: NAD-dependent epimerase/dehydratase family protein [Flavobacteriales bacterium]|nr:NAD-dependent epimerase/dehydratase family protein [Flavobacteriales bacterium]
MNIVTGATGIVGLRILYDLLQKNQKVRALKRASSDVVFAAKVLRFYGLSGEKMNEIEWVDGDILDVFSLESAFQGMKTVYHCAALVSYDKKDSKNLYQVNDEGTQNVVNICLEKGVKNLCHVSSVAALGVAKNGPTSEKNHWQRSENRSVYGLTKYLAEREVWRGAAEGLKVFVVNPSIILGPSKSDQSSGMMLAILKKGTTYYTGGTTGLVDVRDVAKVCIRGVEEGKFDTRYVLNSENLAYRELLELGSKTFGGKFPKTQIPNIILEIAWRISSIASLLGIPALSKETARGAMSKSEYDSSKIKEDWSFKFIPISDSLSWLKEFD